MCGIFAGVGKLSSNRIVALGSMSEARGADSVGLAYVYEKEVRIAKIADRPCVGLNLALRKQVTEAAISGMFIGHTRAATQGAITSENAHPFLMDGVAFAHNGIIINDGDFGKYEVDSMSLIHGIKARDFSKYEGGIALIWIEGGKLHAYRGGNPCYRGRHGTATYLASEKEFLQETGCTHIKALAEGMIYTFHSAVDITTVKVPKNKTYSFVGKAYESYAPLGTYQYANGDTISYDYKDSRYKLNAPQIPEPEEMKEDFRTWKDERDDDKRVDHCDICGTRSELTEGYCFECMQWMKYEMRKDEPETEKGLEVVR